MMRGSPAPARTVPSKLNASSVVCGRRKLARSRTLKTSNTGCPVTPPQATSFDSRKMREGAMLCLRRAVGVAHVEVEVPGQPAEEEGVDAVPLVPVGVVVLLLEVGDLGVAEGERGALVVVVGLVLRPGVVDLVGGVVGAPLVA